MKAVDYLKRLEKLDFMIENKLAEKKQWESIIYGITPQPNKVTIKGEIHIMDRVQASGNPHRRAEAIESYIDIKPKINKRIAELQAEKDEIISTIEQLPAIEYDVLHKIYVQYLTLQDVADRHEKKSYSWAATVHGRALKKLQKILDGREMK